MDISLLLASLSGLEAAVTFPRMIHQGWRVLRFVFRFSSLGIIRQGRVEPGIV